jgi:hypothetical protein
MISKQEMKFLFFLFLLFLLFFLITTNLIEKIKIKKKEINRKFIKRCFLSFENSDLKIIHIIITRFALNHHDDSTKDYTLNEIRVMKKYLLPSLENQSCKDFIWILMLGNKANMTSLKSLLNFNNSFQWYIKYIKNIKNFLRNITKGFDILITTIIDYNGRIYYDAVNDVRKEININKPILFHGYNKGLYLFESDNKYYDFEFKNKNGAFRAFESLIIVLNKVNDIYTIHDFGHHYIVRKKLLKNYKSYGIKELNYDPIILNSGAPKFVWVRQKYSCLYSYSKNKQNNKTEKINNSFNLSKFYGKYYFLIFVKEIGANPQIFHLNKYF